MIEIQAQYSLLAYILVPLATVYCGIFLNLSNNYIFRPKILPILQKLSISSTLALQFLMDIVSNLSFITYSCCSFFTTPTTDGSFKLLSIYCIYWLTFFIAFLMYVRVGVQDQQMSMVVLVKNGLILLIGFTTLLYHYFAKVYFITLPAILVGLYAINVLITVYEDKFVYFVFQLFSIKEPTTPKQKIKMISHLPTIEQLSKSYPIQAAQINQKIQSIKKSKYPRQSQAQKSSGPSNPHNTPLNKKFLNKIDTKILARQKLMKICVCVHLSMVKKQEDQMNSVRHYYALMNGTLNSDNNPNIRKVRQKTNKDKTNFLTNRNKDKLVATRKSYLKTQSQAEPQPLVSLPVPQAQQPNSHEATQTRFRIPTQGSPLQEPPISQSESLEQQSVLFYLFPIRILQSSKILSIISSIVLNLGYGILLSYCQSIMNTLLYGNFCQFLLAALLLPYLPRISIQQFLNTLTLNSIWKMSVCGLFGMLSMLLLNDSDNITDVHWKITRFLQFLFLIVLALLILVFGLLIANKFVWKSMLAIGIAAVGAAAYIYYAAANN